jgi:hypothetical protein
MRWRRNHAMNLLIDKADSFPEFTQKLHPRIIDWRPAVFRERPHPPGKQPTARIVAEQRGYSPLIPFTNNLPPGTELQIEAPGQSIAAAAELLESEDGGLEHLL